MGEWITTEDTRWTDTLSRSRHDVYHRPEYVSIDAKLNNHRAMAYLFQDGDRSVLLPFVVQRLPHRFCMPGWTDAMSPYGFSGPCIAMPDTEADNAIARTEFLRQAIRSLTSSMNERKMVSCFIRLHPLWDHDYAGLCEEGQIVSHGKSVYSDLTQDEPEFWRQTRKRDRSYINRARRDGFRVVRDHQWRRLDEFINIYYASMQRVHATDAYFYPRQYFHELRDSLRQYVSLFLVVDAHNRVAGGGVFTECGDTVEYHLGGTASEYRQQQPSKFMLHKVRLWAKARGHRFMHLGGGVSSREDSLFHFKLGFSKSTATFSTCRIVANRAVYNRLATEWAGTPSNAMVPEPNDGFFPIYRKYRPIKKIAAAASTPSHLKLHVPAAA